MSQHHTWDTPLLFVAAIAGLLGLGIGVGHAMEWAGGDYQPAFSWALAGACLVFAIGHAIGVKRFEMPHLRLVLLSVAIFFIHTFLLLVAGALVVLLLWALVQGIADGGLDF